MAKLSRTQKYQELRDHLDEETTQAQAAPVKTPKLSRVQSSSNSLPHAAKAYFPHEEAEARPAERDLPTSPVIDELLGEVKQYNIQNGNRFTDDTQINILKQLDNPDPAADRRKAHVLPMEEPKEDFGSTMKMPKTTSVESLIEKSSAEKTAEIETVKEQTAKQRIILSANDIRADEFEENDELDVLNTGREEIVAASVQENVSPAKTAKKKKKKKAKRTSASKKPESSESRKQKPAPDMPSAKMRIKVDEYDEEATARKQKRSNRTLNIILGILIVALIAAIGFMIYLIRGLGGL